MSEGNQTMSDQAANRKVFKRVIHNLTETLRTLASYRRDSADAFYASGNAGVHTLNYQSDQLMEASYEIERAVQQHLKIAANTDLDITKEELNRLRYIEATATKVCTTGKPASGIDDYDGRRLTGWLTSFEVVGQLSNALGDVNRDNTRCDDAPKAEATSSKETCSKEKATEPASRPAYVTAALNHLSSEQHLLAHSVKSIEAYILILERNLSEEAEVSRRLLDETRNTASDIHLCTQQLQSSLIRGTETVAALRKQLHDQTEANRTLESRLKNQAITLRERHLKEEFYKRAIEDLISTVDLLSKEHQQLTPLSVLRDEMRAVLRGG